MLAETGKTPFVLKPASARPSPKTALRAASVKDMTRLFEDIAVLMHSGFTIDQSLAASLADASGDRQSRLQERLLASLQAGNSAANSFTGIGVAGDVVALIAAGEASGRLAEVLEVIAGDLRERAKRTAEIREALLYPAFLIAMMFVTLGILAFYLVPAIEPIFEASRAARPIVFVLLDNARAFFAEGGLILIVASVAALATAASLPTGRGAIRSSAFVMPVVGGFLTNGNIALYMRTLGLLLDNGVAPREAMRLSTASAKTPRIRALLKAAERDVQAGSGMHQAFTKTGLFAPGMIARIRLGEESNSVPIMLSRCAGTIERRQKQQVDRLMTFLTPAITISLGLLVGALVISVMSALLSINDIVVR
ncbi:type II secretion system F family protein [Oricola sp.]|uniref:type II secretion system F family protein n=1 Tax=Oricola sp. TaxID=1979950 RepID=UPI0025D881D7|nr:type II secretion system F family protein [Oricola sp.]